ncbi:hypothetical protein BB561_002869 [Smittium simulii]|uniref:ER membrane protein complex subunit 1 n=1 Tax=Smittium simulii TaxID=133385 RepID=A0A2T9YNU3_9FUNG|nr:hypothetical protein BB561_002869 [Smittium simulii]
MRSLLRYFFILVAFQLANAIYHDQIGKLDWHKKLIGKTELFLDDSLNSDVFYSLTENNVLAAINSSDSTLIWRNVASNNERILDFKQIDENIFTISGDEVQYYRMWNKNSGSLIWEQSNNKHVGTFGGAFLSEDFSKIYTATGKSIFCFNSQTGQIIWSREIKKIGTDYGRIVVHNDSLFAMGNLKQNNLIHVAMLKESDGSIIKGYTTASKLPLNSHRLVILYSNNLNPYLLWRDEKNIVWFCHKLGHTNPSYVMSHAKIIQEELTPEAMLDSVMIPIYVEGMSPMIGLIYNLDGKQKMVIGTMFEENLEPKFKKFIDFTHSDPDYDRSTFYVNQNGIAFSMILKSNGDIKYQSFDLKNKGAPVSSGFVKIPDSQNYGNPQAIFSNSDSSRIFIQTNDGLLLAYNHPKALMGLEKSDVISPIWSRDESLADITDSIFVNLFPSQNNDGSFNNILSDSKESWVYAWVYRIYYHWIDFYKLFEANLLQKSNSNTLKSSISLKDTSMYKSIVIFITKYGRISAYDSFKGSLLWGLQIKNTEPKSDTRADITKYRKRPYVKLQKVYNIKQENSESPLILTSGLDLSYKTALTAINPLNGKIISDLSYISSLRAHKIIETDIIDKKSNQKCYLLINNSNDTLVAEVWPHNSILSDDSFKSFYFNTGAKYNSTKISGYKATLNKVDEKDINPQKSSINYINPNNLLVITGSQTSEYGMKVFLLDSVSGKILYSVEHPTAYVGNSVSKKPLSIMSENWAVYYFWSEHQDKVTQASKEDKTNGNQISPPGYTMVSLELFETNIPDTPSNKKTFSSYDIEKPFVITQSFILPNAISALGVTNTYNGITMQSLVAAFRNSPISLIPYSMVDPRRPTVNGNKDLESDYLMPYNPVINPPISDMISYSLSVKGIDKISSTYTNLESTAIVLATGLDVFCARVAPSGSFDELSDSFSKWNLAITILLLLTASITMVPFASRAVLNRAWA